jgi:hypothetical protein
MKEQVLRKCAYENIRTKNEYIGKMLTLYTNQEDVLLYKSQKGLLLGQSNIVSYDE